MKTTNKQFFLLSALWLFAGTAFLCAQTPDAREIVRRSDESMRGKTQVSTATMTIVRPKWSRTVGMKSWGQGNDYFLVLITAPARDKGQAFLKRERELWNWQPTINRSIKMPPSMMSQSWMGSDFSNDDLVRQSSIIEDYTHRLLRTETVDGMPCFVVELIPTPTAPVVWGKVMLWIDQQHYLQLRSEMYDEEGGLVNTMHSQNLQKMGGRMVPTKMEMIPNGKPGHKTILEYQSLVFDQPIGPEVFSVEFMKRAQ